MAGSQAKPSNKAEFNSFVKGLITEASPLNFPQNASVQEQNFELFRDGTRSRRLGMDWETPFVYRGVTSTSNTANYLNVGFSTFVWESPGGHADQEFVVVQYGRVIRIYDNQKDSISFPDSLANLTIDQFPIDTRFSFGVVNGKLVVAAGVAQVLTIDYLGGTGLPAFPSEYQSIKVRDLWGIQTNFDNDDFPDRRPPVLDEKHIYNLYNQGWAPTRKAQIKYTGTTTFTVVENPGLVDPPDYFNSQHGGLYPSLNESVYTGLQFQPAITGVLNQPSETMIGNLYDESRVTSVAPAKGYFIIDLLRRGQSRIDAQSESNANFNQVPRHYLGSTVADYTPGGATVVRGFAGRMWFAGFDGAVNQPDKRSPSLESFVVFSQIVKNSKDIPKCYQEGDPTSREAPDVIATDGGFIRISGCAGVVGMAPLGASLIVFGQNGVWEINGGSDYGFNATNYKVTQLSSVGAFSEKSIVEEVGRLFFWSLDGIYMVGADQFQVNSVQNLTQNTIQTAYENIPNTAKERAVGAYDPFSKKIKWVFNAGTPFSSTSAMGELVFDVSLNAFYINQIGNPLNSTVDIASLFITAPYRTGININDVVAGADQVFAGADLVITDAVSKVSGLQGIKYLGVFDNGGVMNYSFSEYNNTKFLDWEKVDGVGVDAKAFLLTGAQTGGDSSIAKQIPYLTMHFKRTENGYDINGDPANPSSCLVRSQWDFANTINSNKWSSLFQAYRYNNSFLITNPTYDSGFELITTKNKLRGRGKSFSLYIESEPLKDLQIIGWNIAVNGNGIT